MKQEEWPIEVQSAVANLEDEHGIELVSAEHAENLIAEIEKLRTDVVFWKGEVARLQVELANAGRNPFKP